MVDFMQSYVDGNVLVGHLDTISGICSLGNILVDCLVWVDVGRFSVRCYEPND